MDVHIGIYPEKLVAIATLSMSSLKNSVKVEIVRRTKRPGKTNDIDDHVMYRLARENQRFSVRRLRRARQPNVNFAVSR